MSTSNEEQSPFNHSNCNPNHNQDAGLGEEEAKPVLEHIVEIECNEEVVSQGYLPLHIKLTGVANKAFKVKLATQPTANTQNTADATSVTAEEVIATPTRRRKHAEIDAGADIDLTSALAAQEPQTPQKKRLLNVKEFPTPPVAREYLKTWPPPPWNGKRPRYFCERFPGLFDEDGWLLPDWRDKIEYVDYVPAPVPVPDEAKNEDIE
ncbi:hypothetical protein VNI00_016579 [Paramarasmius palmivorus]|uniref:Uncharacterized protein n=1 Tax=Paramarasmius palmivorus TaxID=297713 RepID=A0AAW0BCF9_9AGAR